MHGGAPGALQLVSHGRGLGQRAHAEWLDAGRRELMLLGRIDGPPTGQDQRRGKGRHESGEPFGPYARLARSAKVQPRLRPGILGACVGASGLDQGTRTAGTDKAAAAWLAQIWKQLTAGELLDGCSPGRRDLAVHQAGEAGDPFRGLGVHGGTDLRP